LSATTQIVTATFVAVIRQDYIERLIEQLATLGARILGLADAGKHEAARQELDSCYRSLGVTREMIDRLDIATLVAMLGASKAAAVATVIEAEAGLARSQGREADARAETVTAEALRRASAG
jgi:hypothetical protein